MQYAVLIVLTHLFNRKIEHQKIVLGSVRTLEIRALAYRGSGSKWRFKKCTSKSNLIIHTSDNPYHLVSTKLKFLPKLLPDNTITHRLEPSTTGVGYDTFD